jgi:ADP-ribosylglycohydrolase
MALVNRLISVVHPEGSYANGGVMRIAPVSLVYRDQPEDEHYAAVQGKYPRN